MVVTSDLCSLHNSFRGISTKLARVTKAMLRVPNIELNNGNVFPILGLGTWKSKPGEVQDAVEYALDLGYRHLDCAHLYGNEKEVGEAITKKIHQGVVKREDLFITSKLWNTFHSPELVEPALRTALTNLNLEYLDLYLIHDPVGYKEGGDLFPTDENGANLHSLVDYIDTWKAMEAVAKEGLTRSIGVSNFNKRQIKRILAIAEIKPVVNQVECHPYLNQKKLIDFCKQHDIVITAYSPLGSPDGPWHRPEDLLLLEDPKLKLVADRLGKTPAQILIRYQVDRGVAVIPKSVNKKRIAENYDILDFHLSPEDIEVIDSFDCNGRILRQELDSGHPHHPFEKDEY